MTLFDRWARREQEAAEELPAQASDEELLAWGEGLLARPDSDDYHPRHLRRRPLRAEPSLPRIQPLRAQPVPEPSRPPRTEPLRAAPLPADDVIIDLRDEVPQDPPFRRAWRARPLSVTPVD